MWGKRKKTGGGWRRSSNRACPFCETENPSDATACHQCYYELDVKAMHQSTSRLEDDKDTLWGELIKEVMPGNEEDYSVSVITMDEMTVEVNEYETVGDDEVIIMSQGGPSFAEIMDSTVGDEQDSESIKDALTPTSSPVISKAEVVVENTEPVPAPTNVAPQVPLSPPESANVAPPPPAQAPSLAPPPVPAQAPALVPPPIPSIDGLLSSDDEIDDDLDAIIAAAKPYSTRREESVQVQVDTPPTPVAVSPPAVVPPPTVVPPPAVAPPPAVVPPPAIVSSIPAAINGATSSPAPETLVATTSTPAPANAIPTSHAVLNSNNIWPWPQSEPWDDRVLRRDIIEAMEAARKGERQAAGVALDRLGPHLGNRFDALHHIGALLHSLGRGEQMKAMILVAQKTHPDDPNVSTAAAALLQS